MAETAEYLRVSEVTFGDGAAVGRSLLLRIRRTWGINPDKAKRMTDAIIPTTLGTGEIDHYLAKRNDVLAGSTYVNHPFPYTVLSFSLQQEG